MGANAVGPLGLSFGNTEDIATSPADYAHRSVSVRLPPRSSSGPSGPAIAQRRQVCGRLQWDQAREEEERAFDDFITSPHWHLLTLTGHVGAGKSTFILHKLETRKDLTGLLLEVVPESRTAW